MIKLTFIYLVFKCFFYKFFLSKKAFNTVTNYTLLEKTGYTNLKYNYSKYPPTPEICTVLQTPCY